MRDTITKDHFVCINLSIEDLHPENLEALGLISRRLTNRIIADGFLVTLSGHYKECEGD